jgi:hypothetical protein
VSGAVEPTTGASFFLELPQLKTINVQNFLHEFAQHDQDTLHRILMDKGSGHTAKSLLIPEHMVCLFWPPYSPELHPSERLWPEVTAPLAWVVAAAIEEVEHRVERILTHDSHATLRSLTAYPYVVRAVNAVSSQRYGIMLLGLMIPGETGSNGMSSTTQTRQP